MDLKKDNSSSQNGSFSITNTAKTTAKLGFTVMGNILFYSAVGFTLNLILLLFLIPEITSLLEANSGALRVGHAGGPAIVLVLILLIIYNIPTLLLVLTFLVAFPVLYFIAGKKQGMQTALYKIIAENKGFMVQYICDHVFKKMTNTQKWLDSINQSGLKQTLNNFLPKYLKKLDDMPYPMRLLVRFFLKKVDLFGMITTTIENKEIKDLNIDSISEGIAQKANAMIDQKFLKMNSNGLWMLLGINLVIFTLIKILL
jgi:hypothetical protein